MMDDLASAVLLDAEDESTKCCLCWLFIPFSIDMFMEKLERRCFK